MLDIPCKSHRDKKQVEHKIDVLLKIKPSFFIESNFGQAKAIFGGTKVPVLCTDERILLT